MKNIHAWESSGSGLKKLECVDIFHQSFLRCCAILTSPNWAKQLSMATIPSWFEFFRCHVDVLQHYFSRSTISIAVFCLQNLICLLLEWCWVSCYISCINYNHPLSAQAVLGVIVVFDALPCVYMVDIAQNHLPRGNCLYQGNVVRKEW